MTTDRRNIFDGVLLIGSGKIACGCLEVLCRADIPLSVAEKQGTGVSFLEATAKRRKIPYRQFSKNRDLLNDLASEDRNILIISANNNCIFPLEIVGKENLRIINFHNALLPKHRGRNAPTWAIYEMEKETGITWHEIDPGIDTGCIIAQERISIHPRMTALELTRKCMETGIAVFADILPRVLQWTHNRIVQRSDPSAGLHLSRDVPNEGILEQSWSREKVSAFLRSLDYENYHVFPKPKIERDGGKYTITSYRLCPENLSDTLSIHRDGTALRAQGKGVFLTLEQTDPNGTDTQGGVLWTKRGSS